MPGALTQADAHPSLAKTCSVVGEDIGTVSHVFRSALHNCENCPVGEVNELISQQVLMVGMSTLEAVKAAVGR